MFPNFRVEYKTKVGQTHNLPFKTLVQVIGWLNDYVHEEGHYPMDMVIYRCEVLLDSREPDED